MTSVFSRRGLQPNTAGFEREENNNRRSTGPAMKTATLFHRRSPVVRADAPGKGSRPVLCGPQAAAGSLSFVTARVAGGHSACRTSFQLARSKVAKSRARSNALACAASASGDKPWRENDARLVLENGQVFPGAGKE